MIYEEERRQRPRRRRRRTPASFFAGLVLRLLALVTLCALILYALPVWLFMVEPQVELSPSASLPSSRLNVLLLGVDKLNDDMQRADTMIVASIGYGHLSMTSILRDTMVDIPGVGRGKINAAYSRGGAELAMRTVNENFGLNITKYAVVDFTALADIINALGGVDIAVTQAEETEINRNLKDSWKVFKKEGYSKSATDYLSLDFSKADENGCLTVKLDGFQALAYARIRRIDSDFTRAHRQRKLINAALRKVRAEWYNPVMLVKLAKVACTRVKTNVNAVEILSLGLKAVVCPEIGQLRLPVEGSYVDDGSALTSVDYDENLKTFIEFVY